MYKQLGSLLLIGSLLFATSCGSGGGSTSQNGNGGGSGSGNGNGTGSLQSVNHVIFTFQENRSFDHYFGQLNAYRTKNGLGADVDGLDKVNPQPASNPARDGSGPIAVYKMVSACTEDVSPAWNASHAQRNHDNPTVTSPSTMNGFAMTAGGFSLATSGIDVAGRRAMGYYDDSILPYYYFMATKYATSDRFFSPVMTKSEPNRMFGMAATSVGQIAVPGQTFNVKTIFGLLNDAGISWKVYTINPTGQTTLSYFQPFRNNNADKVVPIAQYYTDLEKGTLPAVAFIERGSGLDEHPNANVQTGAKLMAKIINSFIKSQYYKDSIFILSYDEGGGLYDHVGPFQTVNPDGIPPQPTANNPNSFGDNLDWTGFRVPLIVISPFAKPGFVSHTKMDFTAILKLIETRWKLPNLTARDAAQPDMTEFFDFVNVPMATPPTNIPNQPGPGDPGAAPCYRDRLP
jgi:phospholipase C